MRRVLIVALFLVGGCASESPSPAKRGRDGEGASHPTGRSEAPPAPLPASPRSAGGGVESFGTVDLDCHDEPLNRVLDRIAAAATQPIAASVSTETLVTLTLRAAPWRDALEYVVRAHRLVRRQRGRVILIEEPPHNRLEAQGASPTSWFLLLARQGGFSIIIPGNLPGEIDASLQDVRYEDALRATAKDQGLEVEPLRDR